MAQDSSPASGVGRRLPLLKSVSGFEEVTNRLDNVDKALMIRDIIDDGAEMTDARRYELLVFRKVA